jgi:hypothetical protein
LQGFDDDDQSQHAEWPYEWHGDYQEIQQVSDEPPPSLLGQREPYQVVDGKCCPKRGQHHLQPTRGESARMSQHLYGVGGQEGDSDAGKRPFCAIFPAFQHRS